VCAPKEEYVKACYIDHAHVSLLYLYAYKEEVRNYAPIKPTKYAFYLTMPTPSNTPNFLLARYKVGSTRIVSRSALRYNSGMAL
jgi:hypothetical protein